MSTASSLPQGCGFFVTPAGKVAAWTSERCVCSKTLMKNTVACPKCDTVYMLAVQLEMPKKAFAGGWRFER